MKVACRLVLGLTLAGILTSAVVFAQQNPYGNFGQGHPKMDGFPGNGWGQWQSGEMKLAHDYVQATKDDDKKEIRKKLTETLNKQFDAHLAQQQKELEDLEKKITSLRAVLKKRQEAKNAIVERLIEQLVQDAEGLGWTAPNSPVHFDVDKKPKD
jgi:hypothetical protein